MIANGRMAVRPDVAAAVTNRRLGVLWCLLAGSGLVLVIGGSFLPWVDLGQRAPVELRRPRRRDRLGFADDGPIGVAGRRLAAVRGAVHDAGHRGRAAAGGGLAASSACSSRLGAAAVSFGLLGVAVGRVGLTVRLDPIGPAVMAAGSRVAARGGGAAWRSGPVHPFAARRITRPNVIFRHDVPRGLSHD